MMPVLHFVVTSRLGCLRSSSFTSAGACEECILQNQAQTSQSILEIRSSTRPNTTNNHTPSQYPQTQTQSPHLATQSTTHRHSTDTKPHAHTHKTAYSPTPHGPGPSSRPPTFHSTTPISSVAVTPRVHASRISYITHTHTQTSHTDRQVASHKRTSSGSGFQQVGGRNPEDEQQGGSSEGSHRYYLSS